jgi:hypothetical protein
MTIEVYSFERAEGEPFGSFTTQDITEAQEYARTNGLRIIANVYEWSDSELIEDYTTEEQTA